MSEKWRYAGVRETIHGGDVKLDGRDREVSSLESLFNPGLSFDYLRCAQSGRLRNR
jgi:hypothetical protein